MVTIPIQPVILCGGSGTRLWPLSRAEFPKQFVSMFGKESLFQQAVLRMLNLESETLGVKSPMVVGNEDHRFLILDQLQGINQQPGAILLEPAARNTAAALTLAALAAHEAGHDPVMVVSPADHMVLDNAAFVAALEKATKTAFAGAIVTLGILPDRPETGYGYILAKNNQVEAFVEKPDKKTAQHYINEGCYYWNSGIFVLKASVWLAALDKFRPDIANATRIAWKNQKKDGVFIRPGRDGFMAVPSESIDYAVMEKCAGVFDIQMVPLAAGWSDLGSWDAVWQSAKKDGFGNTKTGDAVIKECSNVFVHSTSRLVSVVGLNDVIVIETPDAVLVADRNLSQDVKQLVADLSHSERGEHMQHRKVHRPWGWYDSVDEGPRFKVKRIMVKPGASLSLQKHSKRAEHWVVVSGTAEVTCGDKIILLKENQSSYIPLGETHRLANPGKIPLEIIEIQSGDYLGEDDIVRLDDRYGRVKNA